MRFVIGLTNVSTGVIGTTEVIGTTCVIGLTKVSATGGVIGLTNVSTGVISASLKLIYSLTALDKS